MRELINNEKDMYCLNGNVIEINNIKFGGCDSSYDYGYMKHYFPHNSKEHTNKIWKHSLNDYEMMAGINNFEQIFDIEKQKIENVYQNCDVMITHVNPSYLEEHIDSKYHDSEINTFFTFDGHKYLKDGSMKYWVFGHTHDIIEYNFHDVNCVCNPCGYPSENDYGNWLEIRTIEVNK